MNETSAYLWKQVQGKEFTPELLVELLMQEYDVAEGEALRDVEQLIKVWCDAGIAE